MSASKKILALSRNLFASSYRNASCKKLHTLGNSINVTKAQKTSILAQKLQMFVRYDSSVNDKEKAGSTGLSNELDSTDPDAIYSEVKYEDKCFKQDTKGREGVASSPDHYSSLDENEAAESLGAKIKKSFSNIFSRK